MLPVMLVLVRFINCLDKKYWHEGFDPYLCGVNCLATVSAVAW